MRRPLAWGCLLIVLVLYIYVSVVGFPDNTNSYDGQTIVVKGFVKSKEIKNDNQVIYLKGVSFDNAKLQQNFNKNMGVVVYLSEGELPSIGSFVMLEGRKASFARATNRGEFDLGEYYYELGYQFPVYKAKLLGKSAEYSRFLESVYLARERLSAVYDEILPENDAMVLKAMALGDKTDLTGDMKELYKKGGISHILAISGLHISVIGLGIYGFLKKLSLPVPIRTLSAGLIMILYVIMAGFSPSSTRALTMFVLLLLSYEVRRTYDLPTGLAFAAALIGLYNPYYLKYAGFWLSFLAVFGIAVFAPNLHIKSKKISKQMRKRINTIISCIGVSIFTLPVLLFYYYEFPVYSVVLNLLVIPLMSVLLVVGIVADVVGLIWIEGAIGVALPCRGILWIYDILCKASVKLPGAHIVMGKPAVSKIVIYYAICIVIVLGNSRITIDEKSKWQKKAIYYAWKPMLLVLALVLIPTRNYGLGGAVLDVGQGDGICICDSNRTYMIDGGSSSRRELAKYVIVPYLKSSGISRIDAWFVTHPDADHISGLVEILEEEDLYGMSINEIVLPAASTIKQDASEIIELASRRNIPIEYIARYNQIIGKTVSFTCLNPRQDYYAEDANEYSVMLLLEGEGKSMIFTGDGTAKSEELALEVLRKLGKRKTDVLKVGHHGSNTSSSEAFLEFVSPTVSIISVGANNRYGHPTISVLERLQVYSKNILRTDESGYVDLKKLFKIL